MAQAVGFASDIQRLFTQIDIDHMSWFCDLASYDDVKANAAEILYRLKGEGGALMPPPPKLGGDGPWSDDKIALFDLWIKGGCLP